MDEERKDRRDMSRVLRVFYVDTNSPPDFMWHSQMESETQGRYKRHPSVSLDRRSKTLSKVINRKNQTSIVPY